MDETDFRILQAMGMQPYLPGIPPADARKPSRIAQRVGLGVKALRGRIAALQREGIIEGYDAFPNLRLFPFSWTSFHFRLPDDAVSRFLEGVRPVDGVVGHFQFLGGEVCIDVAYQDRPELDRRLKLLTTLAGAAPAVFYDVATPEPGRPLTRLDWRIIQELRHDGVRPFAQVARSLRVTERTVRDRFDAMVDGHNLWIVPRLDYGKMPNMIPFGLLATFAAGAHPEERLRHAFQDRLLYSWQPPDPTVGHLGLFIRARTTAEIEQARATAARVPGVAAARILVPTGVDGSPQWLDEAIARKASGPAVSPFGPAVPFSGKVTTRSFRPRA